MNKFNKIILGFIYIFQGLAIILSLGMYHPLWDIGFMVWRIKKDFLPDYK